METLEGEQWLMETPMKKAIVKRGRGRPKGSKNKVKLVDPKAAEGKKKTPLELLPPEFNKQVAQALAVGADKYGPWNWRKNGVSVSTYIGAMRRHLDSWMDGNDLDKESKVSHLAHIAATCAVLIDAAQAGKLKDDRP